MFSGRLQKDLFKGKWALAKSVFKQNYKLCRLLSSPVPLRKLVILTGKRDCRRHSTKSFIENVLVAGNELSNVIIKFFHLANRTSL